MSGRNNAKQPAKRWQQQQQQQRAEGGRDPPPAASVQRGQYSGQQNRTYNSNTHRSSHHGSVGGGGGVKIEAKELADLAIELQMLMSSNDKNPSILHDVFSAALQKVGNYQVLSKQAHWNKDASALLRTIGHIPYNMLNVNDFANMSRFIAKLSMDKQFVIGDASDAVGVLIQLLLYLRDHNTSTTNDLSASATNITASSASTASSNGSSNLKVDHEVMRGMAQIIVLGGEKLAKFRLLVLQILLPYCSVKFTAVDTKFAAIDAIGNFLAYSITDDCFEDLVSVNDLSLNYEVLASLPARAIDENLQLLIKSYSNTTTRSTTATTTTATAVTGHVAGTAFALFRRHDAVLFRRRREQELIDIHDKCISTLISNLKSISHMFVTSGVGSILQEQNALQSKQLVSCLRALSQAMNTSSKDAAKAAKATAMTATPSEFTTTKICSSSSSSSRAGDYAYSGAGGSSGGSSSSTNSISDNRQYASMTVLRNVHISFQPHIQSLIQSAYTVFSRILPPPQCIYSNSAAAAAALDSSDASQKDNGMYSGNRQGSSSSSIRSGGLAVESEGAWQKVGITEGGGGGSATTTATATAAASAASAADASVLAEKKLWRYSLMFLTAVATFSPSGFMSSWSVFLSDSLIIDKALIKVSDALIHRTYQLEKYHVSKRMNISTARSTSSSSDSSSSTSSSSNINAETPPLLVLSKNIHSAANVTSIPSALVGSKISSSSSSIPGCTDDNTVPTTVLHFPKFKSVVFACACYSPHASVRADSIAALKAMVSGLQLKRWFLMVQGGADGSHSNSKTSRSKNSSGSITDTNKVTEIAKSSSGSGGDGGASTGSRNIKGRSGATATRKAVISKGIGSSNAIMSDTTNALSDKISNILLRIVRFVICLWSVEREPEVVSKLLELSGVLLKNMPLHVVGTAAPGNAAAAAASASDNEEKADNGLFESLATTLLNQIMTVCTECFDIALPPQDILLSSAGAQGTTSRQQKQQQQHGSWEHSLYTCGHSSGRANSMTQDVVTAAAAAAATTSSYPAAVGSYYVVANNVAVQWLLEFCKTFDNLTAFQKALTLPYRTNTFPSQSTVSSRFKPIHSSYVTDMQSGGGVVSSVSPSIVGESTAAAAAAAASYFDRSAFIYVLCDICVYHATVSSANHTHHIAVRNLCIVLVEQYPQLFQRDAMWLRDTLRSFLNSGNTSLTFLGCKIVSALLSQDLPVWMTVVMPSMSEGHALKCGSFKDRWPQKVRRGTSASEAMLAAYSDYVEYKEKKHHYHHHQQQQQQVSGVITTNTGVAKEQEEEETEEKEEEEYRLLMRCFNDVPVATSSLHNTVRTMLSMCQSSTDHQVRGTAMSIFGLFPSVYWLLLDNIDAALLNNASITTSTSTNKKSNSISNSNSNSSNNNSVTTTATTTALPTSTGELAPSKPPPEDTPNAPSPPPLRLNRGPPGLPCTSGAPPPLGRPLHSQSQSQSQTNTNKWDNSSINDRSNHSNSSSSNSNSNSNSPSRLKIGGATTSTPTTFVAISTQQDSFTLQRTQEEHSLVAKINKKLLELSAVAAANRNVIINSIRNVIIFSVLRATLDKIGTVRTVAFKTIADIQEQHGFDLGRKSLDAPQVDMVELSFEAVMLGIKDTKLAVRLQSMWCLGSLIAMALPWRLEYLQNCRKIRSSSCSSSSSSNNRSSSVGSVVYTCIGSSGSSSSNSTSTMTDIPSWCSDECWLQMLSLCMPLLQDSDKIVPTAIRTLGLLSAGLRLPDNETNSVECTAGHSSSGTGTVAVAACTWVADLQSQLIDHIMIFGRHIEADAAMFNRKATPTTPPPLTTTTTSVATVAGDAKNCSRNSDATSPIRSTSTASATKSHKLHSAQLFEHHQRFIEQAITNKPQKLIFSICQSLGYLLWRLIQHNMLRRHIIFTMSSTSNTITGSSSISNNSDSGGNNDSFRGEIDGVMVVAEGVPEIADIECYFLRFGKLRMQLQATQLLLMYVTCADRFVWEVAASNNNTNKNSSSSSSSHIHSSEGVGGNRMMVQCSFAAQLLRFMECIFLVTSNTTVVHAHANTNPNPIPTSSTSTASTYTVLNNNNNNDNNSNSSSSSSDGGRDEEDKGEEEEDSIESQRLQHSRSRSLHRHLMALSTVVLRQLCITLVYLDKAMDALRKENTQAARGGASSSSSSSSTTVGTTAIAWEQINQLLRFKAVLTETFSYHMGNWVKWLESVATDTVPFTANELGSGLVGVQTTLKTHQKTENYDVDLLPSLSIPVAVVLDLVGKTGADLVCELSQDVLFLTSCAHTEPLRPNSSSSSSSSDLLSVHRGRGDRGLPSSVHTVLSKLLLLHQSSTRAIPYFYASQYHHDLKQQGGKSRDDSVSIVTSSSTAPAATATTTTTTTSATIATTANLVKAVRQSKSYGYMLLGSSMDSGAVNSTGCHERYTDYSSFMAVSGHSGQRDGDGEDDLLERLNALDSAAGGSSCSDNNSASGSSNNKSSNSSNDHSTTVTAAAATAVAARTGLGAVEGKLEESSNADSIITFGRINDGDYGYYSVFDGLRRTGLIPNSRSSIIGGSFGVGDSVVAVSPEKTVTSVASKIASEEEEDGDEDDDDDEL